MNSSFLGSLLRTKRPVHAFVLSRTLGLGPTGGYLAITAAFSAMAILSVTLFRRGDWKRVKV